MRLSGICVYKHEATSALDNTSEKHIQAEIEKMKDECSTTILSIAHRLTTLRNCDEIIVMDHGTIVEIGTHEELLRHNGLYARLWQQQVGGFLAS